MDDTGPTEIVDAARQVERHLRIVEASVPRQS
jgi:hypothetical protein